MRKDFLNILAKVSKKIHTQKFVYFLCKYFVPVSPLGKIDDAEAYLRTFYPEKQKSCLCNNMINSVPEYDVRIIIPVYNAEKYLDECIQSVIHQKTHYSYQAFFVNDGSSDQSLTILEKYTRYPYISIITTTNGGVSAARNTALKHINSRYVMFLDADDYLAEDAIEKMLSKADETGADIVEGNNILFEGEKILSTSSHRDAEGADLQMHGVVWGKVYKAHIWKDISFPLDYWYEDTLDWLLIYQKPLKKVTIKDVIYYYRATPAGYSRGHNTAKRRIETYWVTKQLLHDAQDLHLPLTTFFYETYLRQCSLNTRRVAMLGNRKVDYALFKAQQALLQKYFATFQTQGEKEKRIESALLNNDFKEYFLYCLFLY